MPGNSQSRTCEPATAEFSGSCFQAGSIRSEPRPVTIAGSIVQVEREHARGIGDDDLVPQDDRVIAEQPLLGRLFRSSSIDRPP